MGQLCQQLLTDGFENAEGRLVGEGQGTVVQQGADQKSRQHRQQPGQIGGKCLFPCQQQNDDFGGSEIGYHAAGDTDYGKCHRCDEPAVFLRTKLPDPPYRALLFHMCYLLIISGS